MAKKRHIKPKAALSIRDLCIRYGEFCALKEVSIDIPNCQITALVGPSGCGKSSFLSSLNRLTDLIPGTKVSGQVLLGDCDVLSKDCDVLALRRQVGMVFQKPNPFPQSIRRNFSIPLREQGFSKTDSEQRMEQTLRDVGLWSEIEDRLDKSAIELSGGQQQRLCIARALALEPEVILFDEPCSALDPNASAKVEELIASLREQVTVVIVTHNLAQARRIADQLAVFWVRNGSGTMVETGPAKELFESATDRDAANYLEGARG